MKKNIKLLISFLLLTSSISIARADSLIANTHLAYDPAIAMLIANVDSNAIRHYLTGLQAFGTRFALASNRFAVAESLQRWFLQAGAPSVVLDSFQADQPDPDGNTLQINIVATIPGIGDTIPVFIAGGHCDALVSYDKYLPISYTQAPGAYDNGIGTTAVLEMARVLAFNRPKQTIRLIAFAGEELGRLGSIHYAQQARDQGMDISCMINCDGLGHFENGQRLLIARYPGSEGYADLLGYATQQYTAVIPAYINGPVPYWRSDETSFLNQGYHAVFSWDQLFTNDPSHTIHDSLYFIDFGYAQQVVRANLSALAIMANYPNIMKANVLDCGDGHHLIVSWTPLAESGIIGYRLYWGRSSGIYTDSMTTGLAEYTIAGLTEDSLYYIGVVAIDDQGRASPLINEVTATPEFYIVPKAPANVCLEPIDSGIVLTWNRNYEFDLAGYRIYRRTDSLVVYDSLNAGLTLDTTYTDKPLSGDNKYYYYIKAVDYDGNSSPGSDTLPGRPITMDQGILLVDETDDMPYGGATGDTSGETSQDSLYHYMLGDNKFREYEYNSNTAKPEYIDYTPYSTVVWVTDDYSELLAWECLEGMKKYLDIGGRLLLAGWKPSIDLRDTFTYPYPVDFGAGTILYDYFHISHIDISTTVDSFLTAQGLLNYPGISVDAAKYPVNTWGGALRYVELLTPVAPAEGIYTADFKNSNSTQENKICGVRYLGDDYKACYLGYPLYYMERDQVKTLIERVLDDFNGVQNDPPPVTYVAGLQQNAPNPFRQYTSISYQLKKPGKVSLKVYNIQGQLVKTLVDCDKTPGAYTIGWDGHDNNDRLVSTGVYIYHLSSGDQTQSRKMIVLK